MIYIVEEAGHADVAVFSYVPKAEVVTSGGQ